MKTLHAILRLLVSALLWHCDSNMAPAPSAPASEASLYYRGVEIDISRINNSLSSRRELDTLQANPLFNSAFLVLIKIFAK